MTTIDTLGAETPEQKAEREDAPARKWLDRVIIVGVLVVVAVVIWMMGVYQGASDPDFWNDLPGVQSPSEATEAP